MTTLIGGEMLLWSDLDGTHGPAPAGGPALRALLAPVTGRVLVAGPHDPALLDAMPGAEITVLVRGVADAETLQGRPGVTVLCGSLEKMAALPAYDTVVALDGLDRLISAEAEDRSWEETLGLLTALLRPGGRLLLGAENAFGLHRLVALPPEPADADWVMPGERTPAGPARLAERLGAAGLGVTRTYAAYPGVLLGPEILADPSLAGYVAATLSAAYAEADAGLLADPVRLAAGALRHGLAADLAPSWVAVTGDGEWPDAVIGDARVDRSSLPHGRTLEDLLLAACRRRDLPAVREMLTGWLDGTAAGVPADQVVIDAVGQPTALAPAGPPLVAVRRFAGTLIRGGDANLWPAPADEAELTAVLAAMTGREVTALDIPPSDARPDRPDVRELLMARDRLTRELAEARAKHEWYEQMLRSREAELKRVQKINAVLTATVPGRAVMSVARRLRQAVRR
ncbi:MAG: hypothetical protein ABW022_13180 [Actinoplanes sp.]